jgi:integrase
VGRREGHVRQRSPGSWEVRYRADGRIVTTTIKGSEKDAQRELRRRLHEVDQGTHTDPSRMLLRGWLERWLEIVKSEVEPKSFERYQFTVARHLVPALGRSKITKLRTDDIQAVYSRWSTGGRLDGKAGGLAPRTRRHIHMVLRAALDRAVEAKIIARNPAVFPRKRLPKASRKPPEVWTAEQGKAFLEAIKGDRLYMPVLLALATGCRRGELLAMRWKHIDLERGTVEVVGSLEQTLGRGLRFKGTKSDRGRTITLPEFAIEALRQNKVEQAQTLLLLGIRQTADTLVCCRFDGEAFTPLALSNAFPRLMRQTAKRLEIPVIRFHDLRHSHATALLRSGVPLKVVSERLGHASISITADTYLHVTIDMQADVAAKLDAAWGRS